MNTKWLIIGPSGSGKTTSLRTWPGGLGKVLLLSPDCKVGPLVKCSDLRHIPFPEADPDNPVAFRKFEDEWNKLTAKDAKLPDGVEVVAIDTLTSLFAIAKLEMKRLNGQLGKMRKKFDGKTAVSPGEWGVLIDYFEQFLMSIVAAPFNVILLAHTMLDKDETTGALIERVLMDGKKLPDKIATYFDEAYYANVREGGERKPVYEWLLRPTGRVQGLKSALAEEGIVSIPQDFSKLVREGEGK